MNIFWIMLLTTAALQALDVATTARILEAGGRELNPFASPLIESYGVHVLWAQKAAALLVVSGLMYVTHHVCQRHAAPRIEATAWAFLLPLAAYPALHNMEVLQ